MSTTQVTHTDSIEEEEREQGKQKKQKSRRPASMQNYPLKPLLCTGVDKHYPRYCLSATKIESMAVSSVDSLL